ncbi:MAG: KH domain-containing protein [Candidatus Cellulosilyticum pullistercoris]|uniref:RNA-binding protein KhpA n=1 Tax=Candidatus Cellulosilyticum pullistercoris TaxID=2838521 RepID=A0A9E2KDB1_9FIRM|nr:KH domain-containing protein [Candidatus Cellulosilyticum pullistercoris]
MKDLLYMIASELVDHPEEVSVSQKEVDNKIVLELKVAPEDMGKVIGKQGRIAKSIRTIIKATTSQESKKVVVDIIE